MANKLIVIFMITCVAAFASEQLVRVELTEDRLDPFFNKDLKIIAELEDWAILLIDSDDFNKISTFFYEVLDHYPVEGKYYLVRLVNTQVDLERFGEVLTSDGVDYLLKIEAGMLEELIKEQVMVKRLVFKPIIKSEIAPSRFFYNPIVQEIIDRVDPDSVLNIVQRLQDFRTRYSTHDSCFAAANYIANKFNEYGCDSTFFQYHTSGHAPNVIGVKRGINYPDSIYAVVCGHFDATSYAAPEIAPGADDNASGTAGVIEAARVMKDYLFEYSVRYIAFSGEEFGLYGSEYYASLAYSQGDSIPGVFNADMIGYVDALPESLEVVAKISNPPCEPLADFFIACADTYTTLLTRKQMTNSWIPSDNQSFLDNGYVALCNIEDYMPVNPHYHSPSDTIGAGYNNNDFCTEVIKAQVAALSVMTIPAEDVYLILLSYWIIDSAPGGNGNGMWESGEEVDLVVQIYNAGIITAENSYASISTTDPYVTVVEDSSYLGSIFPHDTVEASFRVSAESSTPLGYLVDFGLYLGCSSGSWNYVLQVYVNPLPYLVYQHHIIINGNDSILDPGETADLVITLKNEGAGDAINVTSILQSLSSYVMVNDSSGNFGTIAADDTANNAADPYTVTASASAPYGSEVDMSIIVEAGVYIDTLDFILAVGQLVPSDTGYYYVYYSGGPHAQCPVFDWFEIAPPGPGSIISEITNEDADTVTLTLPFTFTYYSNDYNTIGVCSNGFLELGSSTYRFGDNTGIPATGGPRAMVAPLWDDLDPSEAGDIYQYYDDTGHRWIIEFYEVDHYGGPGNYETFQVILYDPAYYTTPTGDGEIVVQYLVAMQETGNTIGIESFSEDVGIQYHCNGVYHELAESMTDSFALKYTTYPPSVGIEEEVGFEGRPLRTMLGVISPNPFRRELVIKYQIADMDKTSNVSLKIYDAAGRLVKDFSRLALDALRPTQIIWDGTDQNDRQVPAGVYFVSFKTGDYKKVEKAILLR